MASRNRQTLKRYFAKGKMPSEDSFTDLIDSMHNIIDDGKVEMSKNEELDVAPNTRGKTIGIYKHREDIHVKAPNWSVNLDKDSEDLSITQEEGTDILRLTKDGRVGINTQDPIASLDVNGNIASTGRIGNYVFADVPADGEWHSVIDGLHGCYLFEVVAGTRGTRKAGKFALLHATAATTYNSRSRIRQTQAYYGSYFHRIRLRWFGTQDSFALQVKTRVDYGKGCSINVQIGNLWLDPDMSSCLIDR